LGISSGELYASATTMMLEVLAAEFAGANGVTNSLKLKGDFGNEDDVGATGDSGVESDPASVAAHESMSMTRWWLSRWCGDGRWPRWR